MQDFFHQQNHTSFFSSKDTLRIPMFVVLKGKQLGENAKQMFHMKIFEMLIPPTKNTLPISRRAQQKALRYLAKPKSVNLIWPVLGISTSGAKKVSFWLNNCIHRLLGPKFDLKSIHWGEWRCMTLDINAFPNWSTQPMKMYTWQTTNNQG